MERLVKHHLNQELQLDITNDKKIDNLLILSKLKGTQYPLCRILSGMFNLNLTIK